MPTKVLIAEDEAVSCRLLQNLLEKWGYQVTVATDGIEAGKKLREPGAARLAVLDWMMPGLDGIQVLRDLRIEQYQVYTYVLLLTSKGGRCDILQGLEAGADDYMVKPFKGDELYSRVSYLARATPIAGCSAIWGQMTA